MNRTLVALLALAAAAILAGCQFLPAVLAGPLVSVELRGGLCVGGPCDVTVTLDHDGRVQTAAKPPNDLGTVAPADVAALSALVASTDWVALHARPVRGVCPIALDGQEIVLTFWTTHGQERLASCEVGMDFTEPLYAAVSATLHTFIPLPVP